MSPVISFPDLQQVLQGPLSLLWYATIGGILLFALWHTWLTDKKPAASQKRFPLSSLALCVLVALVIAIGVRYGGALQNDIAHLLHP